VIGRHIDLIAVAMLLFGMAIYSHAKNTLFLMGIQHQRIIINDHFRPPDVSVPAMPRLPLVRD